MEKMYRLKYQGKWMKVIRMTGTYIYELHDNPDEVESVRLKKVQAMRALASDDNNLNINEIEIVEV